LSIIAVLHFRSSVRLDGFKIIIIIGPLSCHGPEESLGIAGKWDVTVPDTYAESHIGNTATKPGAAAHKTAQNKIDKYSKLASTHIFYPFAIETAGTWHEMAIELTQELAGVSPLSQKTPERQHSFSNAFPWLCKWEMRLLSTTPWSQSKLPLQP